MIAVNDVQDELRLVERMLARRCLLFVLVAKARRVGQQNAWRHDVGLKRPDDANEAQKRPARVVRDVDRRDRQRTMQLQMTPHLVERRTALAKNLMNVGSSIEKARLGRSLDVTTSVTKNDRIIIKRNEPKLDYRLDHQVGASTARR